jgi:flagellar motor switch protein FliM
MNQILSQEEVESLLGGIDEGKVKTETAAVGTVDNSKIYDFSRQRTPLHLGVPALGIINKRFVTLLKESLSRATGSTVVISMPSIETKKFKEFSRNLSPPTNLNIFQMKPLKGSALMVLETSLVFAFVDTLFGGTGVSEVRVEERNFTSIETKMIGKIASIILTDLEKAWSDVHKIQMGLVRSEMDPQFATIVRPEDMVIVVECSVEIENESGSLTLCLPYFTIEPIKDKLKHRFQDETSEVDQALRRTLEDKVRETDVNLSCTLGKARIKGKELLEMKVDDVIPLDQSIGDSIVVRVEGIGKFKGYPGCCNNKQAIRISERLNKE